MTEHNFKLIERLEEIGRAHSASVAQVALAWLLNNPVITAPIVGANTTEQLQETLGALGVSLSNSDVADVNQASNWEG